MYSVVLHLKSACSLDQVSQVPISFDVSPRELTKILLRVLTGSNLWLVAVVFSLSRNNSSPYGGAGFSRSGWARAGLATSECVCWCIWLCVLYCQLLPLCGIAFRSHVLNISASLPPLPLPPWLGHSPSRLVRVYGLLSVLMRVVSTQSGQVGVLGTSSTS